MLIIEENLISPADSMGSHNSWCCVPDLRGWGTGSWPGAILTRILSGGLPGHTLHWMPRKRAMQPLRHILQFLDGHDPLVRGVPNTHLWNIEGGIAGIPHQSLSGVHASVTHQKLIVQWDYKHLIQVALCSSIFLTYFVYSTATVNN